MPRKPGTPKTGGRQKGTPNKVTRLLKDEVLEAAANAHPRGRVAYLTEVAKNDPKSFLPLLGKCIPQQTDVNGVMRIAREPLTPDEWVAQFGAGDG